MSDCGISLYTILCHVLLSLVVNPFNHTAACLLWWFYAYVVCSMRTNLTNSFNTFLVCKIFDTFVVYEDHWFSVIFWDLGFMFIFFVCHVDEWSLVPLELPTNIPLQQNKKWSHSLYSMLVTSAHSRHITAIILPSNFNDNDSTQWHTTNQNRYERNL